MISDDPPQAARGTPARVGALVVLAGVVVAGLVFSSAEDQAASGRDPTVVAGVAMPAARPEPTLTSTWFCAGGSAIPDGLGDHAVLLANPTGRARSVTITALTGDIAPPPVDQGGTTTSAAAKTTVASTSTVPATVEPVSRVVELPAYSRLAVRLQEMVQAPLASAIVEIEGGDIAVEHEITGDLGRATAPCSTTASTTWSFPWGVTERGARELLVFMNPFPDDATVDVAFSTDTGVRDTLRFQGFVVPGRSVVGAYVDQDVTRRAQVSADVVVRGGRLVVDRIQSFDGTDDREGVTLSLGAPVAAETWMFPDGLTGPGLTEQVVVYNPGTGVAEVEVEVRLGAPSPGAQAPEPPEPFELTVPSARYAIVDLHAQERVPAGVAHSLFVRSLNGVGVVAERVVTAGEGATRRGLGSTLGSPLGARVWYFPGGGTSPERDEFITLLNVANDRAVVYDVVGLANGQPLAIQDLQGVELAPGGRVTIRVGDHVQRDDLPLVVTADGPIVVERGLYRVGGKGMSQAVGIPSGSDTVVPDPLNG